MASVFCFNRVVFRGISELHSGKLLLIKTVKKTNRVSTNFYGTGESII